MSKQTQISWDFVKFIAYPDKKIFYTRGTLRDIRVSQLAEIPTLFHDWPR